MRKEDRMNFDRQNKLESAQLYIQKMRPLLNRRALFSDTTGEYVIPAEPNFYEQITIRFRAARDNLDTVYVVVDGEYLQMQVESRDAQFDYYAVTYQLKQEPIHYYFAFNIGKVYGYYDARGLVQETMECMWFRVIPGFTTPNWAKGAVMYQIFVDRFCNGDPSNDVETGEYIYIKEPVQKVEDWYKYPAVMGVREFYGGDLQGVLDKMDYLQELGIEAIYFNPLFVSPSNHKYDIQDYDYIDPHFGCIVGDEDCPREFMYNRDAAKYIKRVTDQVNLEASNALFAQVVEEAHRRGIRVIMDGVFNHCGSFNKWMDRERIYEQADGYEKGAFISEGSPYRGFFQFEESGKWPYNESYKGWWDHNTLPKLNYEESKELEEYILAVAQKWLAPPYNIDGWRLDVAADLGKTQEYNHTFWKKFRTRVKEQNPDALILAEHYGDAASWLSGGEWDSVMNYDAFMEPVTWFLTGMQKHSDTFRSDLFGNADSFWYEMAKHAMAMPSAYTAMNELSNHDHSRFLTRTNRKAGRVNTLGPEAAEQNINKAVMREAVAIQMTWPGAPTVYYGDEAGLCGFTDPDNRRTYPWGREDQEMIAYHKAMILIRKKHQELKTGSIKSLDNEYQFISYGRFDKQGACVIVVNNKEEAITKAISVWELGIPEGAVLNRIMLSTEEGFTTEQTEVVAAGGSILLELPKTSVMVLEFKK